MDLMERYTLENSITRFMVLQPVVTGTHKAREERVSQGCPAMKALDAITPITLKGSIQK